MTDTERLPASGEPTRAAGAELAEPRPTTSSSTLGGARHHFSVDRAPADDPRTAVEQLTAAVTARLDALSADPADVARLSLFLTAPLAVEEAATIVAGALGEPPPPIELFAQPPAGGGAAALSWVLTGEQAAVERLSAGAARLRQPGLTLTVLGHVGGEPPALTAADHAEGLRRFDARLRATGLGLRDAVKLWTVFPSTPEVRSEDAFIAFNGGRADVFEAVDFHRSGAAGAPRYPASTGVGALDDTAPLSGIAVAGETAALQVENPGQVSAFRYPSRRIARPALFSRAVALDVGSDVMTLVAGTGSTVGARTAHVGDPAAQAEQVLRNVDRLISRENLTAAGLPVDAGGLATLSHVVVYAADEQAEEAAREVCSRMLPPAVPMLLVRSRLTRADLLVEADGIAFAPRAGAVEPGLASRRPPL